MKNSQIEFSTSNYCWTYGHEPKGYGMWGFGFEGHEWFAPTGTYAQAKKACIQHIKEIAPADYDGYVIVKVLT